MYTPRFIARRPYATLVSRQSPVQAPLPILTTPGIPASFCGLYSLKPSFGRFPTLGAKAGLPGQEAVKSVNGPMANDLDSLELFAQAVLSTKPWERDPNVLPIPWRKVEVSGKKLAFGEYSARPRASSVHGD